MQVLHRNGEDRESTAQGTPAPLMPLEAIEPEVIDTELEIRASHITAAAVAAAAVTAAVATMAPMAEAAPPVRSVPPEPVVASEAHGDVDAAPLAMPQSSQVGDPVVTAGKALSVRGAMGSILTLAVAALAWWGGDRLPLPEHGLKPALEHVSLPSLRKPGSVSPMTVPVVGAPIQDAPSTDSPAPRDAIALLQQESEVRAQQLAERRAASQARRQREDAAAALREQRRREAEAQLAEARARAERAPAAAVAAPAAVALPEAPPLAEAVRQCSALSLFAREGCLWKLCSGKWGKDGCPSYQQNNEGA
ncbi:phage tail protein [Herbaspirillum sp. alder98]|uniref:phage tail protein n=1 Tax=Herbaspirillum sp. alder98 TaxID=2913096 RepID=UPI001CD8D876|nr:phage tail protein [Herbaspirillum sp. alder98]MCA1324556.1 phage tail protein [Herbaspirillum sp. alder98]